MTQPTSSDEIDLLELLAKGYRTLKKNILLFILCPAIGLAAGILVASFSEDKFSSSMMVSTNLLTENEAQFIFKELEKADSIPGLNASQFIDLLSLSFDVEKNERIAEDKIVYLKITANVRDPKLFPALEKVLVNYLNNAEPVIRHRNQQETYYNDLIKKIDEEIAAMDEIKKQTNSREMATYVAPSDLFASSVDIYKLRAESELRLKEVQAVHLVKGFGSLIKDAKMSKTLAAIIGIVVGGLLAVVIVFIRFFNQYYSTFKDDNK
jgi:hypothetical protein